MSKSTEGLTISDLRYGRNGADPPLSLPQNACVEAYNVDFFASTLGQKRGGTTAITLWTGATSNDFLVSLVPSFTGTNWYLFAFVATYGYPAYTMTLRRYGSSWALPTWTDTSTVIQPAYYGLRGCDLNGKTFLTMSTKAGSGPTTCDRLHCYDWTMDRVRRVGIAAPAAATVANTGSGSYAATIRYYKVAYTYQSAGVTLRRSELSAVVSFTPSGSGTAARVTKPATVDDGETHWELYGSATGDDYVLLATTAVATTTYDDSADPAAYTGDAAPIAGTNIPPFSVRYIIQDGGNRLLMAGSYHTQPTSRVWYTPVLGSSDVGDDERIPNTTSQKNYIDLDEDHGGEITGLAGPLYGSIYVFKEEQTWKLVPTGVVSAPYRPVCMSPSIGATGQNAITVGEDTAGQPCIYFLSKRGPFRLGIDGLQYIGRDIEDRTTLVSGWGYLQQAIYVPSRRQVWFLLYSGDNTTTLASLTSWDMCVLNLDSAVSQESIGRGGWSRWSLSGLTMALFPTAATLAYPLAQFTVVLGKNQSLVRFSTSAVTDATASATETYRAYLQTRPYVPGGLHRLTRYEVPVLVARAQNQSTVTVDIVTDFGVSTRRATTVLTASGDETQVVRRLEDLGECQATAVQFILGDAAATADTWNLDALSVPFSAGEPR